MGYLNEDGLATLVGKVKGQVVQLTSAEYRNLPSSKNSDNKTYFVTDEDYAYAIDDEPTLNSDNLVKSGGVYTYTSKIGSGTLTTTAQTIIPAINELDAAIDTIKNGLTWKRILNVTTTANVQYDQTLTVENVANYNEIMLTLQRDSNGRTFESSACTVTQFQNAGLYAGGSYVLYSGQMQQNGSRWINVVAIWQANTSIEVAVNANDEALTVRVWVR